MSRDIVFVDTSIFVAEKYFAPNNRISALCNLVGDGIISLVSTKITDREILQHFKNEVCDAGKEINKKHKALISLKMTRPLFLDNYQEELFRMCYAVFEKFQQKGSVNSIGFKYCNCNDVEEIFDKYFRSEKPFNEGKKKHEFPDAFVLQMLESYCKKNGLKQIIILSADNDMKSYKSPYLLCVDYRKYLTEKQSEAKILDDIRKSVQNEKEHICEEIQGKINEELQDSWHYSDMFNTEDLPEVEIINCQVEMDDNFSIVSRNGGNYILEIKMRSYCEVKCDYISLDYATYDREDDKWYGGEWASEVLKGEESFTILVTYEDDGYLKLEVDSFDATEAIPNFQKI